MKRWGSACLHIRFGLETRAETESSCPRFHVGPDVETDSDSAANYMILTRGPRLVVLPPKKPTPWILLFILRAEETEF